MQPSMQKSLLLLVLSSTVWGCQRRDYSARCPDGWTHAGKQCQAPLSYGGPCAASASAASSDEVKQQFEAKCAVTWPCLEACTPDYGATCPQDWLDMGGGVCDAPLMYDHHCSKRARMFNVHFKRDFAVECSAHWPCLSECQQDFGRSCPEGWGTSDGLCEAPATYVGPCAPFQTWAV